MYFLVINLEATCFGGILESEPMEIIEFLAILMKVDDSSIVSIFHHYVKPTICPTLTAFCTALTGITQEEVDSSPELPEILELFKEWTDSNGISPSNTTIVTFGAWDVKRVIPDACLAINQPIPKILDINHTPHINMKKACRRATGILPLTIPQMMQTLHLKFLGREHSGIEDTYRIIETIKHAGAWNLTNRN